MNPRTSLWIGLAIVILAGLAIWASTRQSNSTTNSSPSPSLSASPTSEGGDTLSSEIITISNSAFTPGTRSIQKGTTITWANNDSIPHTATSTSGPVSFDSGSLSQSKTFSFTFTEPGTYTYKCSFHSNMTGTIVVTE